MFGPFSGVAALLAATGIAGMAIATVERRTKEIGIRKALGARADQVLILSLARLSRPVLWANLIARPCAWWLMRDWLNGFASASSRFVAVPCRGAGRPDDHGGQRGHSGTECRKKAPG
jgi:hypothetical protein